MNCTKLIYMAMLLNVIDGCICKNQLWSLIEKITSSCIYKVWDKVIYRTNRNESAILWKWFYTFY